MKNNKDAILSHLFNRIAKYYKVLISRFNIHALKNILQNQKVGKPKVSNYKTHFIPMKIVYLLLVRIKLRLVFKDAGRIHMNKMDKLKLNTADIFVKMKNILIIDIKMKTVPK